MQAASGPLATTLTVLVGVLLAGGTLHALPQASSGDRRTRALFALTCFGAALFLALEALLIHAADPAWNATLRRCQGVVAGVVLATNPWLVARLTRRRGRAMPLLIAAAGAAIAIRAVASTSGVWLDRIDRVEARALPWGETIQIARGRPGAWMAVSLATFLALSLYGIVSGWRYRRLPGAIAAWPIILFHASFLVAMANDLLVDAGRSGGPYLGAFTVPLFVIGIWWRIDVERERRVAGYRALFARSTDAALIVDPDDGAIVDGNRAARALLGEPLPADVRALAGDGAAGLTSRLRALPAGGEEGVAVAEVDCRRGDGAAFPAEIALRATVLEGRRRGVLSIRDLTARRRAEAERLEFHARIQHAQKLESIGLLAGGVAHDFNNILMAVLGRASLAESSIPAGHPLRAHLDQIRAGAERAAGLCRQMLAYAGKGSFRRGPLDLDAVVREMGAMLAVSISKQATLRHEPAGALPAIDGDIDQVRQVVLNLITNASDAIGDRPGAITVRTDVRALGAAEIAARYVIDEPRDGRWVALSVGDTGCGMDEATRARIFEPFFTTKFAGRGLGMAAVLGIVRSHRAAIAIESAVGVGTTITVLFPASDRPLPAEPAPSAPPAAAAGAMVLVVDDEELVRSITCAMLENLGYATIEAVDGRDAVRRFAAERAGIDAVVLDMTMPGMGGAECLRELRAIDAAVPVVLVSGYDRDESAARADDAATRFLQKPFDLAALGRAMSGLPLAAKRRGGA